MVWFVWRLVIGVALVLFVFGGLRAYPSQWPWGLILLGILVVGVISDHRKRQVGR